MAPNHPLYWKTHKSVLTKLYDELDSETQRLIVAEPDGPEAKSFDKLVEQETKKSLNILNFCS